MILQNSSAIKTAKILSVARGGVCYRAGGSGAGDLRGVVSEYNMPYSEWTTSMFFLQGAMVTVYSIVFTALFAIPSALFSSAPIVRIKRQRANRGSPGLIGLSTA